jgi:hypothetical protein
MCAPPSDAKMGWGINFPAFDAKLGGSRFQANPPRIETPVVEAAQLFRLVCCSQVLPMSTNKACPKARSNPSTLAAAISVS